MSLGLYVHLPFCRNHCTYCAFAISTDLAMQEEYARAVVREIEAKFPVPSSQSSVESIYFGGGTPSRMSMENLGRIRSAIRELTTDGREPVEFSMECNPEDITPDSLEAWRGLGVDRISIGVQSFRDEELVPLGRAHTASRAREAVSLAAAGGVRTSLDLIGGLPNQTAGSFEATLEEAISLGAGHISLYMLDLEEKSPLAVQVARGRTILPEDDVIAAMYVSAIGRLARAGFHQYEISNFAREGEECMHNLRYWRRGEYLGFGMAAHSFIGGERFANTRDIRRYIATSPHSVDFVESLGEEEIRRETIFLRLRQSSGIDYASLQRLCGQEANEWMNRGLRDGWLEQRDGRVALTPSGFLLSNELISQLF